MPRGEFLQGLGGYYFMGRYNINILSNDCHIKTRRRNFCWRRGQGIKIVRRAKETTQHRTAVVFRHNHAVMIIV